MTQAINTEAFDAAMPVVAPLTPPDCDLRDFGFMPMDVARVRDSDFASLADAEAFRSGFMLWCASWHQLPAGSLPNDDRVLAKLAGFGRVVDEWLKIKAEAMHGWVMCSDGRWYHPVICEKANEAWEGKQQHAYAKFADRMRKKNKALASDGKPMGIIPTMEQWLSSGKAESFLNPSAGNPPEKPLKGQGQGQGQGKDNTQGAGAESAAAEVWTPDLNQLNGQLKMSGDQEVTQDQVQVVLMDFTPHYESHHLSDGQRLSKLRQWISKAQRQGVAPFSKPKARPAVGATSTPPAAHSLDLKAYMAEKNARILAAQAAAQAGGAA